MLNVVDEITPHELAVALERGDPIQILDIRTPHRVAGGRIDLGPDERFHHMVGSQLARARAPEHVGLDPEVPVTVVCDHGNSSRAAAAFLSQLGYAARSLKGGMAAWMLTVVPRVVPATPSLERIVQLDRVGKGALGYVLLGGGEALVVDPPRDARGFREVVEEAGARPVGVVDTHCHADYLSGGPALAGELGVPYYLHPADAVYPYDGTPARIDYAPLADDKTIVVGACELRVVHTPGHTEGSITLVADDRAAFTGDFLFVASLGRPDLAGKTAEWTEQLWTSLEAVRREWPEDVVVYPAHYADDVERNDDRSVGRRLGDLPADNPLFALKAFEEFRTWVAERSGEFPDAYRTIKAVNLGLQSVDALQAEELEMGRNECALG